MDMKAIADDEKREIIEFMLDNAALENGNRKKKIFSCLWILRQHW